MDILFRHPQPRKCYHAVEHEKLVSELISGEVQCKVVYGKAYYGRGDGNVWHKAVGDATAREQSEGKKSQQGTVGV